MKLPSCRIYDCLMEAGGFLVRYWGCMGGKWPILGKEVSSSCMGDY